jgi:hypothetical protein
MHLLLWTVLTNVFLDFLHVELVIFFYHSITWAIPSMCNLKRNLLTLILNFEKKKLSQTKQDQYHVWTCVAAKHSKFSRKDQMTKLQLYFSYGQHQYLYKHLDGVI